MILTKTITLTLHGNYKKYVEKGYIEAKRGSTITILVKDLPINSHINILIKCDKCGNEKMYRYEAYNWYTKNQTIPYYCNKCNGDRRKQLFKEKYGVENPFQSEEIKKKIKQIKRERYGDENFHNTEKTQKTNLEKYGVKTPCKNISIKEKMKKTISLKSNVEKELIKEKRKETNLQKYGVENVNQLNVVQEKSKQTNLQKYGAEFPIQNKEIFEKSQKTGFKLKRYKNTNIYYRGSFELDFLEKFYSLYPTIENAPSIRYKFKKKNKIYYPDFYIPSLNLIIECKNSYLAKKDKRQLDAKKRATIIKGFNYIMIIDKNYHELYSYI